MLDTSPRRTMDVRSRVAYRVQRLVSSTCPLGNSLLKDSMIRGVQKGDSMANPLRSNLKSLKFWKSEVIRYENL